MGTPQQSTHIVSVSADGRSVYGFTDYEISASMLEPVDHFTLTRPFEAAAYRLLVPDTEILIRIDGTPIISGYIDDRTKTTSRGDGSKMTIVGRDKVGRMVQESAPTIAYDGLDLLTVAKELAFPWFTNVSLSGARDRLVRLGKKGRKAAAGNEALVVKVKKKTWQHEPGQARYKILNDLASEAGYMIWSSADGTELIIGTPNQQQAYQYLFANPTNTSLVGATALSMTFKDSLADSYSLVMALGSGRGDAANFGASTLSRRDIVRDGPGIDGTGLDFIRPKRLILAERTLLNIEEARQYAQREKDRRDFKKHGVSVTMPTHGQSTAGRTPTIFAINTIARVIDDEQDLPVDAPYLVYEAKYRNSRAGEFTEMELVPRGTVFAQ